MFMQFDNSARLHKLCENILSLFDISDEIDFFGKKLYNLKTAEGSGLDWWGVKLNVSRLLPVPEENPNFIGFEGQNLKNFHQSHFYIKNRFAQWEVGDEIYRLMILLRFANLFATTTIEQFQKTINFLFKDRGSILLQDNYNMSFDLYVRFNLHAWEKSVLEDRRFLPIPMGVSYRLFIIPEDEIIGFDGQDLRNFERSRFLNY